MTKIPNSVYREALIEDAKRLMQHKIFDIVSPKDNWGHGYAHLAYLHTGLKLVGGKKINVTV